MKPEWREGLTVEGGVPVERIAIRQPVWHSRRVGIAAFRANRATVIEVKVMYRLRKQENKEALPKVLRIASSEVRKFPMKTVGGVQLHLVPISAMAEV